MTYIEAKKDEKIHECNTLYPSTYYLDMGSPYPPSFLIHLKEYKPKQRPYYSGEVNPNAPINAKEINQYMNKWARF